MKHLAVLSLAVVGLIAGIANLRAQTFNTLYWFSALQGGLPETNSDGQAPYGNLVLSGGTLYGTAFQAGSYGSGTVFAINTNGSGFTVLHRFSALNNQTNADGAHSYGGLTLSGGTLYGTTYQGGTYGWGTVFSVGTDGVGFTVLHTFTNGLDGAQPRAGLVLLNDTLYGTTGGTGTNSYGTIFSVKTNGTAFTWLHSFSTNNEGALSKTGLTLLGNVLYGTSYLYGSNGFGGLFSIKTDGSSFTILHTFALSTDGGESESPLLASGDTLFGTTSAGGSNGWGTVFSFDTNNNFNVLYTFTGNVDGGVPSGNLAILGNTLYGTAQQAGSKSGYGTVFSVRTNGAGFVGLHLFIGAVDGLLPWGGVVLSGKTAFGTTAFGGTNNGGSVFSLTVPVLNITNFALIGSNVVLNAEDGLVGGTYSVLTSTDPGAPVSQWKPVATTVLSTSGPFSITATNAANPSAAQQFYMLQLQ